MSRGRRLISGIALLLLACCGFQSGCAPSSQELEVTPLANQHVAALTADDIVQIMQRAGFGYVEIVEYGPALRNSLAATGAAVISKGDSREAMFAVDGNLVHGVSRSRGNFVYDLKGGSFHR